MARPCLPHPSRASHPHVVALCAPRCPRSVLLGTADEARARWGPSHPAACVEGLASALDQAHAGRGGGGAVAAGAAHGAVVLVICPGMHEAQAEQLNGALEDASSRARVRTDMGGSLLARLEVGTLSSAPAWRQ